MLYYSNIISDKQHGFRCTKSAITNYEQLVSVVNKDIQVNSVWRAFDSVDLQSILVKKLECVSGISEPVLKWFISYLCGRIQQIKLGSSISANINITSGVP